MEENFKKIIWNQFGASIDMLENAITTCPEELWRGSYKFADFWYNVFHTLFFLDLYLSGSAEEFKPPQPFTLDELDPAGIMPERTYTKDELRTYLVHCRNKCKEVINDLTDEKADKQIVHPWGKVSFLELLLYNMRHVQHHTAQFNFLLRQTIDSAPKWVAKTKH